ncbi:hypothetical protein ABFX02_10G055000 [Erythranthe guttata]
MAIKVALAAALLVAMVTLASATSYTTTVTTTTIDDEANRGEQQQCRQQIQGRRFQSCQRYLSQRGQYGGDEEEVIEMTTGNPQQQSQYLRDCCQQLQNVNQQCRCEAIKQAVKEIQQQGGQYQTGQSEQVYQKARSLPRQCNFRSPQQCQFHVLFV